MLEFAWIVIIGLIGGVAVGLQSPIAGAMGQRVGGTAGSLIVHVSGAILSALLLMARGGENIRAWRSLPWYMLISGIFGLILYQSIYVVLPRLGGTLMVTLIIAGQLSVGVIVDHFGWLGVPLHPVSATRLLGVALVLLGGFFVSR